MIHDMMQVVRLFGLGLYCLFIFAAVLFAFYSVLAVLEGVFNLLVKLRNWWEGSPRLQAAVQIAIIGLFVASFAAVCYNGYVSVKHLL